MQLGSMFISNCNIALRVSDAICLHLQEHLQTVETCRANRTITNWNQLPASLLASFPCKLSTFRKRVKNVVTSKGIQVRGECK